MFTNKQSNLDNEEIFYDQLWNYLQLSEGQEIYSSKSDVFLGSFSLEENQIWVQINGPDEYHYSYCKNREDLESIVNDFLGEGGSIADIISVIGKKNSDVIIEFNNLSLEHFIDYGIHGEIKESPDDNKIYDQFIDGITYAPKFDQIIDEKLIKIEDAIINFEWINAFKKWQIELVEKNNKNKYMIGSTIFFREKVNSYLDLIKPFALNEIIYFLVAQVGFIYFFA